MFRFVSLASVIALVVFTSGCALKEASGNGDDKVLSFRAGEEPLAVGLPAVVQVSAPDEGLHVCIKGCVDLAPNRSFVVETASCDEGACVTDLSAGGLVVTPTRAGSLKLRVSGRDTNASRADAYTLTAKTPTKLVLFRKDRDLDAGSELGLLQGMTLPFELRVLGDGAETLAFDRSKVILRGRGGVEVSPTENPYGATRTLRAARVGEGGVDASIGPLKTGTKVHVVDPEVSKLDSLELYALGKEGEALTLVKELVLSRSRWEAFILVAKDANGVPVFVGKRAIAPASACFLSFPSSEEDGPPFDLTACDTERTSFEAKIGGAELRLPVRIRVNESAR